jgi:outer membrane immunogenic protein
MDSAAPDRKLRSGLVLEGGADQKRRIKMTKRWMRGAAAAALTVATAVAAQAADLPTRKEAPAPVFVPPPFTWTGFYVGLNAGGIWSSGSRSATLYDPGALWLSTYFPGGIGTNNSGFIGGGQAGYNYQSGAAVFGIETDFDGTSLGKTFNYASTPFGSIVNGVVVPSQLVGDSLYVNAKANLSWLGTTRARIGFVATPDNRLMFYGTGGVAYAGGSSQFNIYDATNGLYWSGNPSSSRVGWTIGAGVEYAVTNNITIRGEYLYADLGSRTVTTIPNVAAAALLPGVYATAKINYDASIFRAGINYKF